MNINIHIDINMNIDIRLIINMNIEYDIDYCLLIIGYSLLAIPYWQRSAGLLRRHGSG